MKILTGGLPDEAATMVGVLAKSLTCQTDAKSHLLYKAVGVTLRDKVSVLAGHTAGRSQVQEMQVLVTRTTCI